MQLEICRKQHEKHRCTRCDLLYITESYITNHSVTPGYRALLYFIPCRIAAATGSQWYAVCKGHASSQHCGEFPETGIATCVAGGENVNKKKRFICFLDKRTEKLIEQFEAEGDLWNIGSENYHKFVR